MALQPRNAATLAGVGMRVSSASAATHLRGELIENMEVAFALLLLHHARLFEQVRVDLGADNGVLLVEVNVDVLACSGTNTAGW
jgi:hypothetical protein